MKAFLRFADVNNPTEFVNRFSELLADYNSDEPVIVRTINDGTNDLIVPIDINITKDIMLFEAVHVVVTIGMKAQIQLGYWFVSLHVGEDYCVKGDE